MKKYEDKYLRRIKKYDTKVESFRNGNLKAEPVSKHIDNTEVDSKQIENTEVEICNQNVNSTIENKSKSVNILVLILSFIFVAAGVALFSVGVVNVIKQMQYETVEATVISVRKYYITTEDGDTILMSKPTFEYFVDGVRYEIESENATSANIALEVGDKVTIKYNPENPQEIISVTWAVIVFFVIGIAFFLIGTFVFVRTLLGKMH